MDPAITQLRTIMTIASHKKIFSNGLVLPEVFRLGSPYFELYHGLIHRVLTFPMPTVAAINGHAFAGGCMFALAHDYRVMRPDVGFMCLVCFFIFITASLTTRHSSAIQNEVDMPSPLPPGMTAIIKCKTKSPMTLRKLILEGHRFNAVSHILHIMWIFFISAHLLTTLSGGSPSA